MTSEVVKHWQAYVLELEHGKYYVGITSQSPEKRMWEHQHSIRVASWTKKYKPLNILETHDLGSVAKSVAEKFENELLRQQMKKFGYNNVRGGDITLPKELYLFMGYFFDREYANYLIWFLIFCTLVTLLVIYLWLK